MVALVLRIGSGVCRPVKHLGLVMFTTALGVSIYHSLRSNVVVMGCYVGVLNCVSFIYRKSVLPYQNHQQSQT